MFVEFEEMPEDSRIWIYQADRDFSKSEIEEIYVKCQNFLTQWSAHGSGLKSSCKVFYNRFLVICVDEKQAQASGCSIDASVNFVKVLGNSIKVDLFERTKIAFLNEERDSVIIESLSDIKNNITSNNIESQTLTFNNLIQRKSELNSKWIIPVAESWMKKYFSAQKV